MPCLARAGGQPKHHRVGSFRRTALEERVRRARGSQLPAERGGGVGFPYSRTFLSMNDYCTRSHRKICLLCEESCLLWYRWCGPAVPQVPTP